ncbi:MAG TPA: adenylate/guanylate cyclase domain-containing protein [Gaiellaceae bacterium]
MAACVNCGVENPSGARFCGGCGASLARTCPACGEANDAAMRFCNQCGAALDEAAAPSKPTPQPAAPQSVAERRLVSVLFADLVGFTSASEKRDAEETRELLSRYFETCRRLIELYGGTVEKFIGDAVMAVWGTPVATEDDAERAVRAALDLVAAVSALGDEVGAEELRARAGVLTGEAAVTLGAEGQGMVAGDLVNTASRIQSVAAPGSVYVGEATRRATEQTIAYENAGEHELQGKGGLYPLFRALRVVSGARGSLKAEGLEAPFVGRDRELRLVKELFHSAVDEGIAHLVSFIGIAGIGKSRLAWEFFKYMDGLPQITYWHRGRCLSYGEGVTYWALADMVRMRCRIAEDEQPASALEKLRAVVSEHVLDDEERRFVEPRVAHLLGLEDGARYERDDLFSAWRVFFERLAAVNPVAMVFEDMQWADDSLLDFIDYLLEWSRQHPIFVCTLARPEIHERRPTWGAGQRSFTSLYLEPLSHSAMEQLLGGLVPGLPDELRAQILERAEGVPLYAVETVRMMLDRGALVQDGPVYRPAGPIAELEVPETLHALIAARLDGLEPEERRLLQNAAVLGKTFTREGLATLAGLDDEELEPLLRALVRKEIVSVQADPRSPEHGQYSFVQDLLRHVAYETLSRAERRSRHLAAAAHLESAFPEEEEVVEVLASHYLDAYREAPDAPDAAEIKVKAQEMLARAGDHAAALAAAREAQRYYQQAAELADDPLVCADLEHRAGQMAWRRGRADEARSLFAQAMEIFDSRALKRPAARTASALAEIDFRGGHSSESVARLEHALESLAGEEPDADVAEVAAQLGRFLSLDSQLDAAVPHLELALELAEALKLPEVLTQALTTKGSVLTRRNRLEEARILLDGARTIALEQDIPAAAIRASNNLAVAYESSDRYAEALAIADRAAAIARRVGDRNWELLLFAGPISSLVLLGRWGEALAREEEVTAGGALPIIDQLLVHLVEIDCWRGDTEHARTRLKQYAELKVHESLDYATSYGLHEAQLLRTEGELRAAQVALEPVLESRAELGISSLQVKLGFVEALECAFELGDTGKLEQLLVTIEDLRSGERPPMLEAHAARFRAKLAGDIRAAEKSFNRATDIFRERELVFWLAVTQLEQAEWLTGCERSDEAQPLLLQARGTFERLEAKPWLKRVDAARIASLDEIPA